MIFIKLIFVSSIIGVYVMFPVYSVIDSLWVCVEAVTVMVHEETAFCHRCYLGIYNPFCYLCIL